MVECKKLVIFTIVLTFVVQIVTVEGQLATTLVSSSSAIQTTVMATTAQTAPDIVSSATPISIFNETIEIMGTGFGIPSGAATTTTGAVTGVDVTLGTLSGRGTVPLTTIRSLSLDRIILNVATAPGSTAAVDSRWTPLNSDLIGQVLTVVVTFEPPALSSSSAKITTGQPTPFTAPIQGPEPFIIPTTMVVGVGATTLTIRGSGFSPTLSSNMVQVSGSVPLSPNNPWPQLSVSWATSTQIVVTLEQPLPSYLVGQVLTATVHVGARVASSGRPIPITQAVHSGNGPSPAVQSSTIPLKVGSKEVPIIGSNFALVPDVNRVTLVTSGGTVLEGTVATATVSSLVVALNRPLSVDFVGETVAARVQVMGRSSPSTTISMPIATDSIEHPLVIQRNDKQQICVNADQMFIYGSSFALVPNKISVTLQVEGSNPLPSYRYQVWPISSEELRVQFTSSPLPLDYIGRSISATLQVAGMTATAIVTAPVLAALSPLPTLRDEPLDELAPVAVAFAPQAVTIHGSNFWVPSLSALKIQIAVVPTSESAPYASLNPKAHVIQSTNTSIVVKFDDKLDPAIAGLDLMASVWAAGVSTGPSVVVAKCIQAVNDRVALAQASTSISVGDTKLLVSGVGFSSSLLHNRVMMTWRDGVSTIATPVQVSNSLDSLTFTFDPLPSAVIGQRVCVTVTIASVLNPAVGTPTISPSPPLCTLVSSPIAMEWTPRIEPLYSVMAVTPASVQVAFTATHLGSNLNDNAFNVFAAVHEADFDREAVSWHALSDAVVSPFSAGGATGTETKWTLRLPRVDSYLEGGALFIEACVNGTRVCTSKTRLTRAITGSQPTIANQSISTLFADSTDGNAIEVIGSSFPLREDRMSIRAYVSGKLLETEVVVSDVTPSRCIAWFKISPAVLIVSDSMATLDLVVVVDTLGGTRISQPASQGVVQISRQLGIVKNTTRALAFPTFGGVVHVIDGRGFSTSSSQNNVVAYFRRGRDTPVVVPDSMMRVTRSSLDWIEITFNSFDASWGGATLCVNILVGSQWATGKTRSDCTDVSSLATVGLPVPTSRFAAIPPDQVTSITVTGTGFSSDPGWMDVLLSVSGGPDVSRLRISTSTPTSIVVQTLLDVANSGFVLSATVVTRFGGNATAVIGTVRYSAVPLKLQTVPTSRLGCGWLSVWQTRFAVRATGFSSIAAYNTIRVTTSAATSIPLPRVRIIGIVDGGALDSNGVKSQILECEFEQLLNSTLAGQRVFVSGHVYASSNLTILPNSNQAAAFVATQRYVPRSLSAAPNIIEPYGGSRVTIQGDLFGPFDRVSGIQVLVGGSPCTSVMRVSNSFLSCTMPRIGSGTHFDIIVASRQLVGTMLPNVISYEAPSVTEVSPLFVVVNSGISTVIMTCTGLPLNTDGTVDTNRISIRQGAVTLTISKATPSSISFDVDPFIPAVLLTDVVVTGVSGNEQVGTGAVIAGATTSVIVADFESRVYSIEEFVSNIAKVLSLSLAQVVDTVGQDLDQTHQQRGQQRRDDDDNDATGLLAKYRISFRLIADPTVAQTPRTLETELFQSSSIAQLGASMPFLMTLSSPNMGTITVQGNNALAPDHPSGYSRLCVSFLPFTAALSAVVFV